jgi:hypothetical protein
LDIETNNPYHTCPCWKRLLDELRALKKMLEKIRDGIDDPNKNLEIEHSEGILKDGDSVMGMQQTFGDPVLILQDFGPNKFERLSDDEAATSLLHELSHLEGDTSHSNSVSVFQNAHNIQELFILDINEWTSYNNAVRQCLANMHDPNPMDDDISLPKRKKRK